MNYLQSFGKIIELKKCNFGDFCHTFTDNFFCLSDDISAVSKKQIMNYAFCRHSQVEVLSVLFIYHLRKLRNAKILQ